MFVSSESVKTNRLVSTITVFEIFGTFCKGQKHLNIVGEGVVPPNPDQQVSHYWCGYFQNSQWSEFGLTVPYHESDSDILG
jgi:hypothetical protein